MDENPYRSPAAIEDLSVPPVEDESQRRMRYVRGMWIAFGVSFSFATFVYPAHLPLPATGSSNYVLLLIHAVGAVAAAVVGVYFSLRLIRLRRAADVIGGLSCLFMTLLVPAVWAVVWLGRCLVGQ